MGLARPGVSFVAVLAAASVFFVTGPVAAETLAPNSTPPPLPPPEQSTTRAQRDTSGQQAFVLLTSTDSGWVAFSLSTTDVSTSEGTTEATAASAVATSAAAGAARIARALAIRRAGRAARIVAIAKRYLRRPYRRGASGPRMFDCSGLVRFVYRKAGLARFVGPMQSARGMLAYFKHRHLASRSDPKVGDLVVWGGGSHVGIYIGQGRAISALVRGVRIHRINGLRSRFTTYLHVTI